MPYKKILGVVPSLHAAAIALENVEVAKNKDLEMKDITELGMKNIVGTTFIKEEASLIGSL